MRRVREVVPSDEYYSRPVKGSWATEGGGALINQAIHQVDILRWLAGPVAEVFACGTSAPRTRSSPRTWSPRVLRYGNGAAGVIQASTAFWPGYPERIEFHGTKGTAIITGDKLTAWDVRETMRGTGRRWRRTCRPARRTRWRFLSTRSKSSSSTSAKRSAPAGSPASAGEEGYQALEIVDAIYRSCRTGTKVVL